MPRHQQRGILLSNIPSELPSAHNLFNCFREGENKTRPPTLVVLNPQTPAVSFDHELAECQPQTCRRLVVRLAGLYLEEFLENLFLELIRDAATLICNTNSSLFPVSIITNLHRYLFIVRGMLDSVVQEIRNRPAYKVFIDKQYAWFPIKHRTYAPHGKQALERHDFTLCQFAEVSFLPVNIDFTFFHFLDIKDIHDHKLHFIHIVQRKVYQPKLLRSERL